MNDLLIQQVEIILHLTCSNVIQVNFREVLLKQKTHILSVFT